MGKLLRGALVVGLGVVLFSAGVPMHARADDDDEGGCHRGRWHRDRGHHYGWARNCDRDDYAYYDSDSYPCYRTRVCYERPYRRYRRHRYAVYRSPRYLYATYRSRRGCSGWSASIVYYR